jgi:LysM repeat protein
MLAAAKQRQLCLGVGHADCATFRAARELMAAPGHGEFDADLWPRLSPRVLSLEPVRTGLAGGLTTPQARAGGQALLVGLIVVAFVLLVIARTSPAADPAAGAGSPNPTSAAGGTAAGSPEASSPAPSLVPATPGPTSESAATASPDPSSAAGRTYMVKRGDTLSSIALKFGVTVKALLKANGLARGDVIRRGQVLVIPGPAATSGP